MVGKMSLEVFQNDVLPEGSVILRTERIPAAGEAACTKSRTICKVWSKDEALNRRHLDPGHRAFVPASIALMRIEDASG